jgi:hypothetical protein
MLVKDVYGNLSTINANGTKMSPLADVLETVFENGVLTRYQTFDEVRANAALA